MIEIAKITRERFKEIINSRPIVVIAVGSIEQHGPHSPLGTDSLIAETIAQEACRRTETLCAPTIFIALSEHHKGFPGTLWVSRQTFFNYLIDISKSLVHQGAKKLIFVNGHGGNTSILKDLCSELRDQLNVISLVFQWWEPPVDLQRVFKAEAVHADGVETSMMAAIDSNLLDMKAFEQINPEEVPSEWSRKIGDSTLPLYTHEFSPSGIAGSLNTYSIEKGREVKEAAIKRLSKVIHELLEFEDL